MHVNIQIVKFPLSDTVINCEVTTLLSEVFPCVDAGKEHTALRIMNRKGKRGERKNKGELNYLKSILVQYIRLIDSVYF